MFADALGYPTQGDDSAKTLVIGGVLSSFGLFLFPLLPVLGYYVSAVRATFAGRDHPPAFRDVGQLSKDGLVAFAVVFVYMLVPVVVTTVLVFVTGGIGVLSGNEDVAVLSILASMFVGLFVGGVLALLFSYLAYAGVINYAREGTVGAAFDVGTILDVVTTGAYFRGWIVGVATVVTGGLVTFAINSFLGFFFGFFGLIPLVGILISLVGFVVQWTIASFVGFYTALGSYRAAALGFRTTVDG